MEKEHVVIILGQKLTVVLNYLYTWQDGSICIMLVKCYCLSHLFSTHCVLTCIFCWCVIFLLEYNNYYGMLCYDIFSQGVGVTATLPDKVPHILHGEITGPQHWHYGKTWMWNNRKKCSPELPDIYTLTTNQTIGLLISSDGGLHFYLDGRHITTVSGLPVDSHLWGAVDVKGICTRIKSELLSGELDDVCMYLYF